MANLEVVRNQVIAMRRQLAVAEVHPAVRERMGNLHADPLKRAPKQAVKLDDIDLGVEPIPGSRLSAVKSVGGKGRDRRFEIHHNWVDVVSGVPGFGSEVFQVGGELLDRVEVSPGEEVGDVSTGRMLVVVSDRGGLLEIANKVVHGHDPIAEGDVDPADATATVIFGKVHVPDGITYSPSFKDINRT
jgi:hypothetical protein